MYSIVRMALKGFSSSIVSWEKNWLSFFHKEQHEEPQEDLFTLAEIFPSHYTAVVLSESYHLELIE